MAAVERTEIVMEANEAGVVIEIEGSKLGTRGQNTNQYVIVHGRDARSS